MSFAQIILEGFIAKDSEMKHLQSGTAVANSSMAITKKWKTDAGEKKEKTVWYKLTAWGKSAESFHAWAKKGTGMLIVGELEDPDKWTAKNGELAAQNVVRITTWTFSSAKKDGSGQSDGPIHVEDGHEFQFVDPEAAAKIDW